MPAGGKRDLKVFPWDQHEVLRSWQSRVNGWIHFRDLTDAMSNEGGTLNIGYFLGRSFLESFRMRLEEGSATDDELEIMRRVMRDDAVANYN